MGLEKRLLVLSAGVLAAGALLVTGFGRDIKIHHSERQIIYPGLHDVMAYELKYADIQISHPSEPGFHFFESDGIRKAVHRHDMLIQEEMNNNYEHARVTVMGKDYHSLPKDVQEQVKPYLDQYILSTDYCLKSSFRKLPHIEITHLNRFRESIYDWKNGMRSCIDETDRQFYEKVHPILEKE